jgi:ATP-dependent Clp protease ATP-binding subunit ClpX
LSRHGIVLEELKSTGSSKLAGDLILKKPKEIRAFLRSICNRTGPN